MRIFSFLKKLGKEKEIQETVSEKLAFSEIESWLEKKVKENEFKEKEILVIVKDKIREFNEDLKIKIVFLKNFDVESKKAEDRIKGIVSDSRIQYIGAVDNLMDNLENFKETKFSELTKRIDKIFSSFNKASFKNYERATILIGKEMANIKEGFKTFSKDLLKIFNHNKEIGELFQNIEFIKSKLNSLNFVEKDLVEINESIVFLNEKIKQEEKDNQELLREIKEIKQSEDYKNMLEKKEKINVFKEESKNNILNLKQLIDFKALANFFHINKEQMKILKEYKENFQTNFEKDNGKQIISFLDESKLNNEEILEKIRKANFKLEEINNYEQSINDYGLSKLNYKIKERSIEIDNLKIEKFKKEKRDERLKENKEDLIDLLKQKLSKMNVEVV
ncbi:hypothetical protein KAI04_04500 [Candidatus Pacearchaeota archaeon]|nr:hypothetical protein [Candidatus Pacearchaeota archaeon]